jgi:hypothetical protein
MHLDASRAWYDRTVALVGQMVAAKKQLAGTTGRFGFRIISRLYAITPKKLLALRGWMLMMARV